MIDTFFKEDESTHYKIYAVSFFITLTFMMLSFGMFQYAPVGNNSLACMDAHWQYLDFFAYLKDVIQGNNSVFYSLTNTLGGTGLGVYSYYLASPLNLLVVLFEKKELHSFFNLLVALKIALAGASMAFFLEKRFTLHSHILLCLSLAYALSQYNIAQANIYKPIKYLRKLQGKDVEYTVSVPQGNYSLYGNLPWRKDMDAVVYKNKMKLTSYSRWLSPSVFYIPSAQKERTVNIKVKTKNGVDIKEEQFYALDLDLLKHVSRVISSRQVTDLKIDKTTISCTTDGKEGDRLFLSVPYHKGWTVTINGKVVLPELLDNCLMVLPLEKGANRIQMHYRVPYIVEGCILTLLGFACLLIYSRILNVSSTV